LLDVASNLFIGQHWTGADTPPPSPAPALPLPANIRAEKKFNSKSSTLRQSKATVELT